ncbi:hypothetical protein BN137_130 [Cronobacter condimenti 1330]|uniref:Uncharacterized protein n=1 Tax=Cronobacter condimenti 1330 TaxID=1073999 RepID=K8A942_9ENTR|nr:hypothetical protein AFK62_15950 [Cronobacter condimenti 1330]CCJ70802.1 hypothetical protein BN137_130 [Cronobacter condimenti 1330]
MRGYKQEPQLYLAFIHFFCGYLCEEVSYYPGKTQNNPELRIILMDKIVLLFKRLNFKKHDIHRIT